MFLGGCWLHVCQLFFAVCLLATSMRAIHPWTELSHHSHQSISTAVNSSKALTTRHTFVQEHTTDLQACGSTW